MRISAVIFGILALFCLSAVPQAFTRTIYVDAANTAGPWDGTSDYPFLYIQDGIDAASPRDRVEVAEGEYPENIEINVDVTVASSAGAAQTRIDGSGNSLPAIAINDPSTSSVKIAGFSIYHESASGGGIAVLVSNQRGGEINIWSNIIRSDIGVEISNSDSVFVEDNEINCRDCGIRGDRSSGLTIGYNRIEEGSPQGNGIELVGCQDSVIQGNEISGNVKGVYLENSGSIRVVNNLIKYNPEEGIHLKNSRNIDIQFCTFYYNRGSGYTGQCVLLTNDSSADLDYNIFAESDYPVYSRGSSAIIRYCCDWRSGSYWGCDPGEGCFNRDPEWRGGELGNYYLDQDSSPCVNPGGENAWTAREAGMDVKTTDTAQLPDRHLADMGYHHSLTAFCLGGRVSDAAGRPVENVEFRLIGAPADPEYSGSDGDYVFTQLAKYQAYTVTPYYRSWTFDPPDRQIYSLNRPILDWDFTGYASPTPTPSPTPPPPPPTPRIELRLNGHHFRPGDHFLLELEIENGGPGQIVDAYVLLDVWGEHWFWPSWGSPVDYKRIQLPAGSNHEEVLLEFDWPAGAGTAAGIKFWGAVFSAGTFDLLGEIAMVEFGFSEGGRSNLKPDGKPSIKKILPEPEDGRKPGKNRLPPPFRRRDVSGKKETSSGRTPLCREFPAGSSNGAIKMGAVRAAPGAGK